jgi:transcriptional regulator with XRE-family HTH domain
MLFEERLREAMGKAGINQSDLAKSAGASKASISQYLSGKNGPRRQVVAKLAEILGVDEAWLGGRSDEPLNIRPRTLRPRQAAKVLGSNVESVRIRMQKGSFSPSIGTACKLDGFKFTYEVYPEKLAAFLNVTVDEVFARLNA